MKERIVIALGGNALGNTPQEQLELVKKTAKCIVDFKEKGFEVIVGHGNGPQVGMINSAMDFSFSNGNKTPYIPFAECGAMSQGYIGYHLQQAIQEELSNRNIKCGCVTLITQVVVNQNDEGFLNPTKPIGNFYSKEEADVISKNKGFTFINDSFRGYRRVVPSPKPIEIVELEQIKKLAVDNIVITVGGGGIPVVRVNNSLKGVDAVIDKDRSCSLLATNLDATKFIILTTVEKVSLNFKKENETFIDSMNIDEALKYINEDQFAKGSMLPKVEACVEFVKKTKKCALISSLEKGIEAIEGKTGTVIKYE